MGLRYSFHCDECDEFINDYEDSLITLDICVCEECSETKKYKKIKENEKAKWKNTKENNNENN